MLAPRKSIPVRPDTVRRLDDLRKGGRTYDDVLNELMDEVPPKKFLEWHRRELATRPRVSLARVKAKFKA